MKCLRPFKAVAYVERPEVSAHLWAGASLPESAPKPALAKPARVAFGRKSVA